MSDDDDDRSAVLRFTGDGSMRIPGVPLRDLTKADLATLSPELVREAEASPLYEAAGGTGTKSLVKRRGGTTAQTKDGE